MGRRLSQDKVSDRTELVPQESQEAASATMESRSRATQLRGIVGICLLLVLASIVYLGYFCPDHVCALTKRDLKESVRIIAEPSVDNNPFVEAVKNGNGLLGLRSGFKLQSLSGNLGYDDLFANDSFQFNINAHDVMVFLHIQKTGKINSFCFGCVYLTG